MSLTSRNHFVPKRTLRRWSHGDVHNILVYDLLVPHSAVPLWKPQSIKTAGARTGLYTPDFETYLTQKVEEPGQNAIDRLISGKLLSPLDWLRVARFVASQQLRTPLGFMEMIARANEHIPQALDQTIRDLESALRAPSQNRLPASSTQTKGTDYFTDVIHVSLTPVYDSGMMSIVPTIKSERAWVEATIRHHLQNNAQVISKHCWRPAEPDGQEQWPLSDHPVLNINYNGPTAYDFGGGWGKTGSEFIMPVTPRLAVYTRVGSAETAPIKFTRSQTHQLQRLMVERSYRSIFAHVETPWIVDEKPRTESSVLYKAEVAMWSAWKRDQELSEAYFRSLQSRKAGREEL